MIRKIHSTLLWLEVLTLLWLEVLTFPAHVDLETLGEAAGLTLVPASHVHHTAAVLLTDVLQVPTAIYGVT